MTQPTPSPADTLQASALSRRTFEALLSRARGRGVGGAQAWQALEAAHIVGQAMLGPHLRAHMAMLGLAWRERDAREIVGQVARLALAPLGHAFRRLPLGNPGRANVGAFAPMPIRPALAELIKDATREALEFGGHRRD